MSLGLRANSCVMPYIGPGYLSQTKHCRNLADQIYLIMKTADTIRIPNPSEKLIVFFESAQKQKTERLRKMRIKFLQSQYS